MRVHRLAVNAGRPTIALDERKRLRAAIHELESTEHNRRSLSTIATARGRIARLRRLHPDLYRRLKARVDAVANGAT
jgi:hypothetical protein